MATATMYMMTAQHTATTVMKRTNDTTSSSSVDGLHHQPDRQCGYAPCSRSTVIVINLIATAAYKTEHGRLRYPPTQPRPPPHECSLLDGVVDEAGDGADHGAVPRPHHHPQRLACSITTATPESRLTTSNPQQQYYTLPVSMTYSSPGIHSSSSTTHYQVSCPAADLRRPWTS